MPSRSSKHQSGPSSHTRLHSRSHWARSYWTSIFPFSVSGEYTTLAPRDPVTGQRDMQLLIELFTMLKRAGATATVTYGAIEAARTLT